MGMTTIGALPAGSLALIQRGGNNSFVGYAIRVDPTGAQMSPVIFLGPKPVAGPPARAGVAHPTFVDLANETPCLVVTEHPTIEPIFDQENTGCSSIRSTFGNPNGQGKLFFVDGDVYIQVDDLSGDYYYVKEGEWALARENPVGATGVCTHWRINDGADDAIVLATFKS